MISEYREKLDNWKAEHRLLAHQLEQERAKLSGLKEEAENLRKARVLIQQAALDTQETLKLRMSAIVTTALQSVFDKDMDFRIEFESKRGRTEAVLEVGEEGEYTNPMDSHGGGVVDIVSLSLRAAFWSIARNRPVLVLDEPFRFLSRDLQSSAADMIRMLSAKLGLQFIVITHIDELIDGADKVFHVSRSGHTSRIRAD